VIPHNYKLLYAAYFGCKQRHIKYWTQLSSEQQNAAILKYAGVDMAEYVYRVSVAGLIIDRRIKARDDNGQIPSP
jgi:hypothetical protein